MMKKYEVPFRILNHEMSKETLAIARLLMDCLDEEELYSNVSEFGMRILTDKENKTAKDYLDVLEIPEDSISMENPNQAETFKNYDVPLFLAGKEEIQKAIDLMEHLKKQGPKKPLTRSDFGTYENNTPLLQSIFKKLSKAKKNIKNK